MKRLIIAAALALCASPAWAEPVDLVCSGEFSWFGESYGSAPVSGIHVVVTADQVEVSGFRYYSGSYAIDPSKGDEASIFFISGLWMGSINRYSGELIVNKCKETGCASMDHAVNATCGKADPLF